MGNLPEKMQEALDRVKRESNRYVSVKLIRRHCYVYESTSRWDKEKKKVKGVTRYLGRITKEGLFIPGTRRDPYLEAAVIEPSEKAYEGYQNLSDRRQTRPYSSRHEAKIVFGLSMDGRASIPKLSRSTELKPTNLEWHKKQLERKYGISYMPEVNPRKLGFNEYLAFIKFGDRVPSTTEMQREIGKEPLVQLALLTQGEYDMVLYMLLDARGEVREEIDKIRDYLFPGYDLRFYLVPLNITYGFVPLRDAIFQVLNVKRTGNEIRSSEENPSRISRRESIVLRDLNRKGNLEFSAIDSRNKLGVGSSRYTYKRLLEKGIVRRTTISLTELPMKYMVLMLVERTNQSEFAKYRNDFMKNVLRSSENIIDRYALVGELTAPEGMLLLMPIFSENDLNHTNEELRRIKGIRTNRLIITSVIAGSLCYRKLDGDRQKLGNDSIDVFP